MNTLFVKNEGIHHYVTRQEHNYHVPIFKTNVCNRFIRKTGIYIYGLRSIKNLNVEQH